MAKADCVTNAIRTPSTDVGAKTSTSPVGTAYAEFVADLASHPPRPIRPYPDAADIEDRADHLSRVFATLSVYLTVILDDTAQNLIGGLDLSQIDALLSDLASDVTGTLRNAAETVAGGANEPRA
jgi:hypothetical protein